MSIKAKKRIWIKPQVDVLSIKGKTLGGKTLGTVENTASKPSTYS